MKYILFLNLLLIAVLSKAQGYKINHFVNFSIGTFVYNQKVKNEFVDLRSNISKPFNSEVSITTKEKHFIQFNFGIGMHTFNKSYKSISALYSDSVTINFNNKISNEIKLNNNKIFYTKFGFSKYFKFKHFVLMPEIDLNLSYDLSPVHFEVFSQYNFNSFEQVRIVSSNGTTYNNSKVDNLLAVLPKYKINIQIFKPLSSHLNIGLKFGYESIPKFLSGWGYYLVNQNPNFSNDLTVLKNNYSFFSFNTEVRYNIGNFKKIK